MLSSKGQHCLAMIGICLIMGALIVGMVACSADGNGIESYTLTITSSSGGSVTEPGEGVFTCNKGKVVNLAVEPDEGYRFLHWTGNVETIADVDASMTDITMNSDCSIMAIFEETAQYDLTISSTIGGLVTTPGEGRFTYHDGTVVNLVVEAEGEYYFVGWTGDVGTIANVDAIITTVTMYNDYEISANFEQIPSNQFALTISSASGGSVTMPGEATFVYDQGTVVNLVADPDDNHIFANWTGDVGTIANVNAATTTITMSGNYYITANFDIETSGICDWYDLDGVRNNLGGSYVLMNDLDSTTAGYEELASSTANDGKGWQPIGTHGDRFTGTFDGQGYEIGDLYINRPDESSVGLFGYVHTEGIIQNIGVANVVVTGSSSVGGLVGRIWGGTVTNSYSIGSVSGWLHVGGLAGIDEGTVSDCYSGGTMTADRLVGGLIGSKWSGTVSNSHYNYDEVLIKGQNMITIGALPDDDFKEWLANGKFLDVDERLSHEDGYYSISSANDFKELLAFGQDSSLKFRLTNDLDLVSQPNLYIPYLAGEFDGNCHKVSNLSFNYDFASHAGLFGYLPSSGNISEVRVENADITGFIHIGGLVGYNYYGNISNSHSAGSVNGYEYSGGLVGLNKGIVSNCYATTNMTGEWIVGGLAGYNSKGTVSNSYATGTVTRSSGEYAHFGGFVGSNAEGRILNCYSTGSVHYEGTADPTDKGFAGSVFTGGDYEMLGDFWDIETSGQTSTAGNATGKTTSEMQDISTFSGATWDIIGVTDANTRNLSYIWNIVDDETYPFLSWQPIS
ncbi:MAG: GLUG motif-containing protein [Dehalococcoidia bacterium]